MRQNLAAVTTNYRRGGISLFVLAYFVRSEAEVQTIRAALDLPLTVVRLTVPLDAIEQRLVGDVTSGRRDDLREAAASLAPPAWPRWPPPRSPGTPPTRPGPVRPAEVRLTIFMPNGAWFHPLPPASCHAR
jgi:hypothetical protein